MLQALISDDLILTLIGQFASFCGLIVCLTISMYGGNEHGKMPETYTYEQFIEYRRAHGTDATKKKLQEIEKARLEKAKVKKSGSGNPKNAAGGKHGSKHQITTTKKRSLEENKTKKDKPNKLLDQLGFSSRSKKTKKKDPMAQSDRQAKTKHRSLEADEVFIDDPMRKAASPPDNENSPLVALDGGHFDKSHTGSSSTSNKGAAANPLKPPSLFTNLETSSKKPKKDKQPTSPGHTDHQNNQNNALSKETLTARETKTKRERKENNKKQQQQQNDHLLQPAAFPTSPSTTKPKAETDDEFTPTVFEMINAPVKPVTEKRKKTRSMSQLGQNKQSSTPNPPPAPSTFRESKKKKENVQQLVVEEEVLDKTIEDDCAVDMDEPEIKPKAKDLNKIKEKLKEKHQKMIERQKKLEKKKTEQKKLPKDTKKQQHPAEPPTDRATAAAKKKPKRKSSNQKDKTITSKPSDDKKDAPTVTKQSSPLAGTGKAKSPAAQQKTPSESKETGSDFNDDKTTRDPTVDSCDRTEDEEIFTLKDEKLVRGIVELRKVKSATKFVEKPPEKLRITASARFFGHLSINPRLQKASLKAIEKIKKTSAKKPTMSPHQRSSAPKTKSSTSVTSTT